MGSRYAVQPMLKVEKESAWTPEPKLSFLLFSLNPSPLLMTNPNSTIGVGIYHPNFFPVLLFPFKSKPS